MMTILFNSSRTGSSLIPLKSAWKLNNFFLDCLSPTLSQTLGPTNWLDFYDILPDWISLPKYVKYIFYFSHFANCYTTTPIVF